MSQYLLLLLLAAAFTATAQPANDDPCNATPLTVNTASCVYIGGTNVAATSSAGVPAPGCGFYNGGDVWYSAVVPANGILIVDTDDGTLTDAAMAFYSGTCSALTLIECDDNDSPNGSMPMINRSGLTPGSTIFIRIWEFGNNVFGTFNICASTPNTPPNDNPCSALPLTVNNNCSFTAATNTDATPTSGIPAPGCGAYLGGDVWFTYTVPASGAVYIDALPGTMTDGAMAVYSAPDCNGPFSLIACDDDNSVNGSMPYLNILGQTPGSTLYIRFWEFNNDNRGTFSICVQYSGACGFPETNNFCPDPAPIFQGAGTFSSTTDGTYTADIPGNLNSVFCGTLENNSWYQFTASATTETFPITSVTGCNLGLGIQGVVYDVTYNAMGCCTNFSPVSNCYSPSNTSLGTITATGLTIGQDYLLMIDGYSNDGCEFTISGWNIITPLGAELVEWNGINNEKGILLHWKTASEAGNEYFEITHSSDGVNFSSIGTVEGAGISHDLRSYSLFHEFAPAGLNYYRLHTVDVNGESQISEVIAINREVRRDGLVTAFPNPATEELKIQYYSEHDQTISITLYDQLGKQVLQQLKHVKKGIEPITLSIDDLKKGIYLLETNAGNHIEQHLIVKK